MTSPLRRALAGLASTALAAAGIVAVAGPALAAEVCPHSDGWTKVEAAGESTTITVTAPAGTVIVQTCVKAATSIAYATVDPGQATVTLVTPASNGRGIPQAISHYAYRTAPVPVPAAETPGTPETPTTPPSTPPTTPPTAPPTPETPSTPPSTPPAPSTPSAPETPSTPATPSTPETGVLAGGGAAPVAAPSVPAAAPVAAATGDELAATGVEGWQIALALLLVAVGGGFVVLSRRARHA